MYFTWFSCAFLIFMKFLQVIEERRNFLRETNSIIWPNYYVLSPLVGQWDRGTEGGWITVSIFSWKNQLSKTVNHLVHLLPSVFQFWKFKGPKLYVIDQVSVYFTWFSSAFLSFVKLVQSMEGAPIFFEGTNSVKWLIYVVFSSLIQL